MITSTWPSRLAIGHWLRIGLETAKDLTIAKCNLLGSDPLMLLAHELGHAVIGLGEGWVIRFAENPAREALGFVRRTTYGGISIDSWISQQPQSVYNNIEREVGTFVRSWK